MPRLLFRRWCHLVVVVLALSSVLVHCASGSSSNDPSSMFQLNPRVENNTKTNANGGGGDDDSSKPRKTSSDKEEKTTGVDDGDDDDLIIKNPSFIPSDDDGSSSDGEDDESSNDATEDEEQEELLDIDDEEEYEEEEDESDAETLGFPTPKLSDIKAAKKAFDGALTKTSKQSKKYIKLAKKHKASITVAITVIAFRREIMKTLAYFWRKQFVDPKTGKFDWKRINITNLVKLILIADAIRKVYLFRNPPDTEEGNYNAENHVKLIVALSTTYPILGILFTNFTPRSMYNPSYVPPIEQHWMFERINERYVKDGMALSKSIQASHEKLKW
jgi:cobalamin biosynthesis protein CobT